MAYDSKYGLLDIKGIPEKEPIFILRAQDAFAIHVLKVYRGLRESSGDIPGMQSVQATIDAFGNWVYKKLPD